MAYEYTYNQIVVVANPHTQEVLDAIDPSLKPATVPIEGLECMTFARIGSFDMTNNKYHVHVMYNGGEWEVKYLQLSEDVLDLIGNNLPEVMTACLQFARRIHVSWLDASSKRKGYTE